MLEDAAAEEFNAFWHHHSVWQRGGFPNAEFEAANVRCGNATNALRCAFDPPMKSYELLPLPVEGDRDGYIQKIVELQRTRAGNRDG